MTWIWLSLVFTTLWASGTAVPVNVALNKPVSANITCGTTGIETYYGHNQILVQPRLRVSGECEDVNTHPASAMVDGDPNTWWQSTSRSRLVAAQLGLTSADPEAIIILDLDQEFSVEQIILSMGDSKRPDRLAIEKSFDGVTYRPWVYVVTSTSECQDMFGVSERKQPSDNVIPICIRYESIRATTNETMTFDFQAFPLAVKDWKLARYLKLQFYEMELTLGATGDNWQHYTVRDIEVMAECICNGHQTDCAQNNLTGQYSCVCGGNTEGLYCERCQPYYNQAAFTYGIPCESCNCFNHSEECYYNQTVDANNLSFNSSGIRAGGGVCIDCQHNTSGVNCEKCEDYFFRPHGRPQTHPNACVSCDCHMAGVTLNLETGLLGDCVMNNDSILPIGKAPGDCFCKSNVIGSKCDQCAEGYFNLSQENPQGCQDCLCHSPGTIGGSGICEPDNNGQCPCKEFTTNRICDMCMDGYYGLESNNTQGCSPCNCDVGGSTSPVCNKTTGQCPCRPNVAGLMCDRPADNYYYPSVHFISAEFENLQNNAWDRKQTPDPFFGFGYGVLTRTGESTTQLDIPAIDQLSGQFHVVLRYMANGSMDGNLTVLSGQVPQLRQIISLNFCPTWCYIAVGNDAVIDLQPGSYTIQIQVPPQTGIEILLDQVIALPVEFRNATEVLGGEANTFHSTCDVVSNLARDPARQNYCDSQEFSLTSYYLNGAVPCNCDILGSNGTMCQPKGGQCTCKPGVTGQRCDQCMVEFYSLTSAGCAACECASDDKICDFVTGQCKCPPNTEGRQCDQCVANHWGWDGKVGCQACGCNATGSVNLQCNLTTGVCACQPGVHGAQCLECLDEYAFFSPTGCVACNCNTAGSTSTVCDKGSGQCPCKSNTVGQYCGSCRAGTYHLSSGYDTGCLDCICMGITQNCASSGLRYTRQTLAVNQFNDGISKPSFEVMNATASKPINATNTLLNGIEVAQATISNPQEPLYWRSIYTFINDFTKYYGSSLNMTVHYINVLGFGAPLNTSVVLVTPTQKRLYYSVPEVQVNTTTTISVKWLESFWRVVDTNAPVSRGEFLTCLADVKWLLLPASWSTGPHVTSIEAVQYEEASTSGTGSLALSVEQCVCPPGYDGLSCERCATGYKRENVTTHGYLGVCIPCECNGHAEYCDPDTGECKDCRDNTTGTNCELCAIGYYGDATQGTPNDCRPCPCYSPRVMDPSCAEVNGSVQCLSCALGYTGDICNSCLPFFYGNPEVQGTGTCTECDCNGNSLDCDTRTGVCSGCSSNTTGLHCERCIEGMFGDASQQNCRGCDCVMTGSTSAICNHTTGQCDCRPGVGTRDCGSCLENYWGYNIRPFNSCIPCDCNVAGSTTLQCAGDTGVCSCKSHTAGDKCDQCAPGLWGLPYRPCEACACNTTGSVNASAPCDTVYGQCECKPGVTGRQCDQCEKFFIGFGPAGCTRCLDCQYSLGTDTLALQDTWQTYWNVSSTVGGLVAQDAQLQQLTQTLTGTLDSIGFSESTLFSLEATLRNITNKEAGYNQSVISLQSRVQMAVDAANSLRNEARAELNRLQDIKNDVRSALQSALEIEAVSVGTISQLTNYSVEVGQLLAKSREVSRYLNQNFSAELSRTAAELAAGIATATDAQATSELIQQQSAVCANLEGAALNAQSALSQVEANIQAITTAASNVMSARDRVMDILNQTEYQKSYALTLFSEAEAILNLTAVTLNASRDSFLEGQQAFAEASAIVADGIPKDNQIPLDAAGHQYMIMFMENRVENGPKYRYLELFITPAGIETNNVTVQINQVYNSAIPNMTFVVSAGEVKKVNISVELRMQGSVMTRQGLEILASDRIVVYALNKDEFSTDGFLSLPRESLGTDYYTVSYYPPNYKTQVGVAAMEDNTEVIITLPQQTFTSSRVFVLYRDNIFRNGNTFTVMMNKFDTLQLQDEVAADLTGTRIQSSKLVAVFSGNVRTNVGQGTRSRDHLAEQIPPISSWGRNFAVVPIPNRTTGDVVKIVASQPNTELIVANATEERVYTLTQAGSSRTLLLPSSTYCFIAATKPILVAQIVYSQLTEESIEKADPSMILIPSIEHYSSNYHFALPKPSVGNYTHYFLIAIEDSAKNGVILDGQPLPSAALWHPIPFTTLVGGYFVVSGDQAHTITHTDRSVTFMGVMYGAGDRESYGLPIGMRVRNQYEVTALQTTLESSGKKFVVMYMENRIEIPTQPFVELFVTPAENVFSVLVNINQVYDQAYGNRTLVIQGGQVRKVDIPVSFRVVGNSLTRQTLEITSSEAVVVYGVNKDEYSSDAFLAYPTTSLGKEYYVVSYAPPTISTELGIAGVHGNTRVSVTFSPNVQVSYGSVTYGGGDTLTVTLNQFSSLQLQSQFGDLTGTRIVSDKPVAVFSGNVRTSVQGNSRDHLVEQLTAVQYWGTEFATVPVPQRTVGDIFRVVASADNTIVNVRNSTSVVTSSINTAGGFVQLPLDSATYYYITSNFPVQVVQIVKSQLNGELADPSMFLLPPVARYSTGYHFSLPAQAATGSYTHYFMLVIENKDKHGLLLDGQPLNTVQSLTWNTIPGTSLVGTYFELSGDQSHFMTHSDPSVTFMGLLYGAGDKESYGLPIGLRFADSLEGIQAAPPTIDAGREYMVAFMENRIENPKYQYLELFLTAAGDAVADISVSISQVHDRNLGNSSVVLRPGEVTRVNISVQLRMEGTTLSRQGIEVKASGNIILYGLNKDEYSTDAFLALPQNGIGTDYYTVSYSPATTKTEFVIVGTRDDTVVTVTLPNRNNVAVQWAGQIYSRGESFKLTLNRFDTVQIQSPDFNSDLTGTHIQSDRPVTVLSGNVRTQVGQGVSRDHLVEQIPPVSSWGRNFATVPIPNRSTGDIFRVVASQDNTIVTIRNTDGDQVKILDSAGGYTEFTISSTAYSYITSNHPILLVQIVKSQVSSSTSEVADPAMMVVPPFEHYSNNYHFLLPSGVADTYVHYFLLVIESDLRNDLRLDGTFMTGLPWQSIPGTNKVGTFFEVTGSQAHVLNHVNPNVTFMGMLYGAGDRESYGLPIGMRLVENVDQGGQNASTGFESWTNISMQLKTLSNSTEQLMLDTQVLVQQAEQHAQTVTAAAQAIQREFSLVESRGAMAVDAIQKYQDVARTLNSSLYLAQDANNTVTQAMQSMQDITVVDLQNQAQTSSQASLDMKAQVDARVINLAGLNSQLNSANSSLQSAVGMWAGLETQIANLEARAAQVNAASTDPGIMTLLDSANTTATQAQQLSDQVLQADQSDQSQIQAQEDLVAVIQTSVNSISVVTAQINAELQSYNIMYSQMQSRLTAINQFHSETNATRYRLSAKMASIEAKLARAKQLASSLERPVSFPGTAHITVQNPSQESRIFNELSLEFRASQENATGVIFYADGTADNSWLALYVNHGTLVFEFNLGSGIVRMESLATICSGCWLKVLANRYTSTGHLTVTRMSTGGSTTAYGENNVGNSLQLGADLVLAGVPSNAKASGLPTTKFPGCITNLHVDNIRVDLWSKQIENSLGCCTRPVTPAPEALLPGVSFDGFGHLHVNPGRFSAVGQSRVSLEFRTFSYNGVLMLAEKAGSSVYYGMYLQDGRLIFEYGTPGNTQALRSSVTYNDGDWYKVDITRNATYASLNLQRVSDTGNSILEIKSVRTPAITLSELQNGTLYFGGVPQSSSSGIPMRSSFAGCIREAYFYVNSSSSVAMIPREMVNSSIAVSLDGCFRNVIYGAGFRTDLSYSSYAATGNTEAVNRLEIDFKTSEPSGLLFFTQDPGQTKPSLYVALYHGNVFVEIGTENGPLIRPLMTTGFYLADDFLHTIQLDLSANRPRLVVDGINVVSLDTLSSDQHPLTGVGSNLYIGGVSSPSAVHTQVPVLSSFAGGVQKVAVNSRSVDFFSTSQLTGQAGLYLSGVPAPPGTTPPPPYTTTLPPPTTAPPTCAPSSNLTYLTDSVRFGDQPDSYMAFNISNRNLFNNSFVLITEFRALSPNGVLYYAANRYVNPEYWIGLYLENGYLVFTMSSSTRSNFTRAVKSRHTYDNGEWWEATVLRINDFIALVVAKDYRNNQQISTIPTSLFITTNFYLGGVDSRFGGTFPLPIGKTPFHGCIRKMEMNSHNNPNAYIFSVLNPDQSLGTSLCYASVNTGTSLNGAGYLKIVESVTVEENSTISLTFRAANNTASLVSIYSSNSSFFSLEVVEGRLRAVISNAIDPLTPFMAALSHETIRHIICDNNNHTVTARISRVGVSIEADQEPRENYAFPRGFVIPTITAPLYVGGVEAPSRPFITRGLEGCVKSISVNGNSYNLRNVVKSHGSLNGCPV